jgi:outer membrane protein OmpA-like peptidoglycan-associated protein
MFRLAITCSAAVAVLTLFVGSAQPGWAFGPSGAMSDQPVTGTFGSGSNRLCSVLVDVTDKPVLRITGDAPVNTLHTYDCPEVVPVAQVAPAAPPPPAPLPAQGVIYFDFDKANLNPTAEKTLNSIIADIKGRELGGITVSGFTDTAGPADYNMKLSQRRANTVAADLVKAGIPASIITTEAFGQTHLAVETPDNTPKQANRRATIDFKH